ncbi:hypothetical protein AX16_001045 [Volvariella volvacea WC 439]|nr:hypothetical protein AX16_001045 [Volvariella volvacea WC 439]
MSLFVRPDSPPPRQPSPDFVPAPLPSPYTRLRVRTSSQQQSSCSDSSGPPALPPGLGIPAQGKRLLVARSCDHIGERAKAWREDADYSEKRLHSGPALSPQATNRSSLLRSYSSKASRGARHEHRYTMLPAPPYSPLPGPTNHSPPTTTHVDVDSSPFPTKPAPRPQQSQASSIRFPTTLPHKKSDSCLLLRKQDKAPSIPPEKHRSLGMACLRFFLRSRNGSSSRSSAA